MKITYVWSKFIKKIKGKAIRNSYINRSSKIEAGSSVINSTLGKYSFCGYDCKIFNCSIGSFCSIADNVKIGLAEHPIDWVSSSPVFYSGKDSVKRKFSNFSRKKSKTTYIGNDVWIGENVIIKAGVNIGTGAVIAMGAVVTRDVEPYEIVGGVPAKHIRYRFDRETFSMLLSSKWWDLNDNDLFKLSKYIREPRIFCEEIEMFAQKQKEKD